MVWTLIDVFQGNYIFMLDPEKPQDKIRWNSDFYFFQVAAKHKAIFS